MSDPVRSQAEFEQIDNALPFRQIHTEVNNPPTSRGGFAQGSTVQQPQPQQYPTNSNNPTTSRGGLIGIRTDRNNQPTLQEGFGQIGTAHQLGDQDHIDSGNQTTSPGRFAQGSTVHQPQPQQYPANRNNQTTSRGRWAQGAAHQLQHQQWDVGIQIGTHHVQHDRYAAKFEREKKDQARLEKKREYAAKIGISGASYLTTYELDDKIAVKKDETRFERTKEYATKLGISDTKYLNASELDAKINNKKTEVWHERKIAYASKLGISNSNNLDSYELDAQIAKRKEQLVALRQAKFQSNNASLILNSTYRTPGEKVSYKKNLAERKAFTAFGAYDESLYYHSDNASVDLNHYRSDADVIKKVEQEYSSLAAILKRK